MSALNRFLLEEEVRSTTPSSSPPLPVASTRSENRVTRSCRSSSTSLSFCWMSAGEEQEGRGDGEEGRRVDHCGVVREEVKEVKEVKRRLA